MDTAFQICAGLGGALMLCQFALGVLGVAGDHDHDTGHDHDHDGHGGGGNWFLGLLTFRSVAAAVLFFGLGGLTARYYDLESPQALSAAAFAAAVALYSVAAVMKGFQRLRHDGTARLAVGQTGTVYLRVPGGSAAGKVTLAVQNRTVECEAYAAAELPTGAAVRVVAVRGANAVEVEAV